MKVNFVADIATVSDKGLKASNPFEALWKEISKKVEEHGLNPNMFDLQVERIKDSGYKGGPKVKLKLPGPARFSQIIIGVDFDNFLLKILKNPDSASSIEIKNDDADVKISFNPMQKFASGGHPIYDVVYSLTENSIYHALDSTVSQLKGTGFNGQLGIFLCDGGCNFFTAKLMRGLSFSIDEVIQAFLINNEDISFVVTFSIVEEKENRLMAFPKRKYVPSIRFYSLKKTERLTLNLPKILDNVNKIFPKPQRNSINALNLLKGRNPHQGASYWGGMGIKYGERSMKVKISGRAILELLAGHVKQKEFFERHELFATEKNPFMNTLNKGYVIKEVSLEKSDLDDDDWILFELEGPDPAIFPFEAPKK